jgi:hypothetical protein
LLKEVVGVYGVGVRGWRGLLWRILFIDGIIGLSIQLFIGILHPLCILNITYTNSLTSINGET